MNNPLPLLGIVAHSGTGKTTLLKQLIPILKKHHVRVGVIKHTHHDVDIDVAGKDSDQLRKAGADQTLIAHKQRWALMTETPECCAVDLRYLARQFDSHKLDLVLVEGFKSEPYPKIVLYREGLGHSLLDLWDNHIVAVASDCAVSLSLPCLNINDPEAIAQFIVQWLATCLKK